MKILKIITLLLWLIEPNAIKAKPIKGISDFDGSFKEVERITFECPTNDVRKIQRPDDELEDQQKPKEKCWVDFYSTYLNVMNKQVINKNDVISFWESHLN